MKYQFSIASKSLRTDLSFFLVIFLGIPLYSLTQDTTFLDKDWETSTKDQAVYYRIFAKENGNWTTWDYFKSNDQLQNKGAYKSKNRKLPIGKWEWWAENGQLVMIRHYKEGEIEGIEESWYEDGTPKEKGRYNKGEQTGAWEYWYANGQKKADVRYNPEHYLVNFWLTDGKQTVQDGNGKWTSFHSNGNLKADGLAKNGIRVGVWKQFFENGQVYEEVQFDEQGLAQGKNTYYYPNGKVELVGNRVDGKKDGIWVYWDSLHQHKQQIYVSSARELADNVSSTFGFREPFTINLNEIKKRIGYPKKAVSNGLEGTIHVKLLIESDGTYLKHKISKGGPKIFIKAIEKHIQDLRFVPASIEGRIIRFWVVVPFTFRLT